MLWGSSYIEVLHTVVYKLKAIYNWSSQCHTYFSFLWTVPGFKFSLTPNKNFSFSTSNSFKLSFDWRISFSLAISFNLTLSLLADSLNDLRIWKLIKNILILSISVQTSSLQSSTNHYLLYYCKTISLLYNAEDFLIFTLILSMTTMQAFD